MANTLEFPPAVNPDDPGRGPMIVGLTWTFTSLAVIAVALRFYVRKFVTRALGWDDWLMLFAVVLQVANQALVTVSFHYGLGKHDTSLKKPDQMIAVLKWNWIASLPGMIVSILARISIAILLIRLFGVYEWFKRFLIVFTILQTTVCTLIIPFTWLQDNPVQGLWDVYDRQVKHWDPRIVLYMEYFGQSLYTFSDLTYVLFPVIIIWNLNMPVRQKIGLMLLMAASLFTMSMSIMKVMVAQGSSHFSPDVEYNASLGVLWSGMEQTCVIIMGCVPPLRAITKLDFTGLRGISSSLSSLVGRDKNKQSSLDIGHKSSTGRDYNHHELKPFEFNHVPTPIRPQVFTVTAKYSTKGGERTNESPEMKNRVRRTDHFAILDDYSGETISETTADIV
ncbi:uncharacterized protein LY89DRAFT_780548 [Mollisia scopiformis]|uniref:Rhodopsin domain-containing protein n=1 Tax=Mollisia scopiformis TaxID=149040 RepID=A0A194XE72_MOLSC|nr:uncharacterized protein LY89DRAFT_780548 [Mollisia scopiformis]KUJ18478.1 hypothetical protein LY89DRAFT_780548 [Mollisia scopiformis]